MTPNNNQKLPGIGPLLFYFGLVYFMQGLAQASGLVSQPLNFFFKEALGLNPAQVTEYLAILTFPWIIKPLYGLISDYIPLLGYRRKSWLMLMNTVAAGAFLWMTGLDAPSQIVTALMLTAFGTAASDVIVDALMVEKGKALNATGRFQSVQWLWFYTAAIGTSLAGGYLCQHFSPSSALHIAALITMFAPITVVTMTWFLVKEEKAQMNVAALKETTRGLKDAVKSRLLWAVALFIAFWNFSPSFGTPFYYHMTDTLKFSQDFIGTLGAISSVGSVIGAWLYGKYFAKKTTKFQLVFSIITGVIGTLAYLSLVAPSGYAHAIAVTLNLVFGVTSMVATLSVLTLAAKACPEKAEGFTFAALMSVNNFAAQMSAIIGARLFVSLFQNSLTPLIFVSAAFTAACILLLPLLRGVKEETNDGGPGNNGGNGGDKPEEK